MADALPAGRTHRRVSNFPEVTLGSMSVVGRVAFKLPSVRALQEHARLTAGQRDELARQVQELSGQRDALKRERDELSAHCRRLDHEAGKALQRESQFAAE